MFGSLSNQIFKEDYISALIESIVHLKKYQESYLNCLIFKDGSFFLTFTAEGSLSWDTVWI